MIYSEDELMSEYDDLSPHIVLGQRVHGGFRPDGQYQPPRARGREDAFDAWSSSLESRGGGGYRVDASLLDGARVVNVDQQRLLLRNGLGQWFWNQLTVIGKIEAKGRLLADAVFPDLQPAIVEDISEMAIGHLGKGLLLAHGLDEGGSPDAGIGGHDVMWFVARDLAFGAGMYPEVEPAENIARPEAGTRLMPEIPADIEGLLSLLANLLIIEFRAELGFAESQAILRSPDVFTERREEAELAAEVIERIRTDELIHVRSLCLYLGELCGVTFRTVDGGSIAGRELIDRFWGGLVHWATVEQPKAVGERVRMEVEEYIATHDDSERVQAEFDAFEA